LKIQVPAEEKKPQNANRIIIKELPYVSFKKKFYV